MTPEDVSSWATAQVMIGYGIRPPIVHAATGLCRNRLRNLYREIHGKSAVQGRVSEFAYHRLKTKEQVRESAVFLQFYHNMGGDVIFKALDHNLVMEAYKEYLDNSKNPIDASTAWYIGRDLREGVLKTRRCKVHKIMYLYEPRSDHMLGCPLCGG